jgi:hypothetical protein
MRMAQNLIVLPVLAQILLPLLILPLMARARGRSMARRRQGMQDVALAGQNDWDEPAQKLAASFSNQFELPVLFYVVCAFALITRMVDAWMLGLAVLFVASRIVHAAIHIGPNIVRWRFAAFLFGVVMLTGMWALLAVRILAAGL